MAKAWIGTSGYSYKDWGKNGLVYPEGLPSNKWFEYYATKYNTVELNVTFYRLPSEATFEGWHRRAPKDFLYFAKGSRYITHIKRLKDPDSCVRVFADAVSPLKERLAGALWQFPPNLKKDMERFGPFVGALAERMGKTRHVFEFRDESWIAPDVAEVLGRHGFAFCHADWPNFYKKRKIPVVADYVYVRRHGMLPGKKYQKLYSEAEMKRDARQVKKWLKEGKDVFVYFNNDVFGHAVMNADQLVGLVEGKKKKETAQDEKKNPAYARARREFVLPAYRA